MVPASTRQRPSTDRTSLSTLAEIGIHRVGTLISDLAAVVLCLQLCYSFLFFTQGLGAIGNDCVITSEYLPPELKSLSEN